MFAKILIANRGEIACRVIRTARRLGIATVAVYSDADRDARHVRLADEARHIGPAAARDSYLNVVALLDAARATCAEAVHPGYGFLSENGGFAAACAKAGLVFIGPTPESIAAMGDKAAAKALMGKAGVPLLPGYHDEDQDPARLAAEAAKIGFPVLIKASAGGGGKGMRIVRAAAEFGAALQGAQREARAAFGDSRVLIEKYLERPRHIEIQVFGDSHGSVVHLFERDCSVQRRYQKVLEEAPAPGMTAERRRAMGEAAVSAARAIGYRGAGTVEFISESATDSAGALNGRFYFMEMNTRLQVEHPVTEMITGLDLVEWQLRVAAGEPLPLAQDAIAIRGHAIEARVYAERPEKNFLPSTGRLLHLAFPAPSDAVRIDTGVEPGAEITPWYDPMIAKLVVHGADRREALARLRGALAATEIAGVGSNVEFLARVAACRSFSEGDLDTTLIERERANLFPPPTAFADKVLAAAALAELFAEEDALAARAGASADPHSPWNRLDGWRLNGESLHRFVFLESESPREVVLHLAERGHAVEIAGRRARLAGERLPQARLQVHLDGETFVARVLRHGLERLLFIDGGMHRLTFRDDAAVAADAAPEGSLVAPMPGKVVAVLVAAGAKVSRGTPLVVLEAMKMEHQIVAPRDGRVAELFFRPGDPVAEGALLLRLESE
jgi:3-methylcrotonyl-CoA carboxylase alpha subunit